MAPHDESPRFGSFYDLARLPYFELRDGRLVLADRTLGPAVDVHTHLALSYGPGAVDLLRETPAAELYLRPEKPLDFGVYMNRHFAPHDLAAMERDLGLGSLTSGGMRTTHTLPNLLRDLGDLGFTQCVLLPIDLPVASHNSERWLEATRGERRTVCFGSVHPFRPGLRAHLDALVALGARGLKVHPAVQLVGPDHPRAMKLYRLAAERRLPILFHCGPVDIETRLGRRLSQVYRYEKALAENPDCTFVLGHSGALQMEEAIAFAARYPNAYYEIASQSLPAVRRLLDALPAGRLMTGSDWPFYHPAIPMAKVLLATEGDERARRAVLYDNAARLFGLPSREALGLG